VHGTVGAEDEILRTEIAMPMAARVGPDAYKESPVEVAEERHGCIAPPERASVNLARNHEKVPSEGLFFGSCVSGTRIAH
jgi:hypothetical protein